MFPLFLIDGISFAISIMLFRFNSSQKKVTEKNLNHCDLSSKQLLRLSINKTSESMMHYPYVWGNPKNYTKLIEKYNSDQEIFSKSESKLIFTLHMGCVDVMLNLLSDGIKGLDIIYTPAKNNELDKIIRTSRTFFKANMIPANEKGMIQLYKNFLNKKSLAIASDLVPHNFNGKYSKFFDKKCFSIDLIEKLSKKGTHNIYFVYFSKGLQKKYKFNVIKIGKQLTTDAMNQYFEKAIKETPELYGWEYKKFRKLDKEKSNIY
jgi:KDO2-lipid IV(A) lauroyltransferase